MNLTSLVVHGLLVALTSAGAVTRATAGPTPAAGCAELPRPSMRIRLVIEPGVPSGIQEELEVAVATVWRAEGITISWLPEAPAGQTDPATALWLRITPHSIGDLRTRHEPTLGLVRFVGQAARADVLVSYGAVREWVRRERDRRFRVLFPGMTRLESLEFGGFHQLARRALGYAAAHEIGHFVLGSKTHDATGLMRRDLVPRTVAATEHRDLRLSDTSRLALADRLVQAAACPTSSAHNPQ
jgi:hypothetical protein